MLYAIFVLLVCLFCHLARSINGSKKATKSLSLSSSPLIFPKKYSENDTILKKKSIKDLLNDTTILLTDEKSEEAVEFLLRESPNCIWNIEFVGLDLFPFHKDLQKCKILSQKIEETIESDFEKPVSSPAIYYFNALLQIDCMIHRLLGKKSTINDLNPLLLVRGKLISLDGKEHISLTKLALSVPFSQRIRKELFEITNVEDPNLLELKNTILLAYPEIQHSSDFSYFKYLNLVKEIQNGAFTDFRSYYLSKYYSTYLLTQDAMSQDYFITFDHKVPTSDSVEKTEFNTWLRWAISMRTFAGNNIICNLIKDVFLTENLSNSSIDCVIFGFPYFYLKEGLLLVKKERSIDEIYNKIPVKSGPNWPALFASILNYGSVSTKSLDLFTEDMRLGKFTPDHSSFNVFLKLDYNSLEGMAKECYDSKRDLIKFRSSNLQSLAKLLAYASLNPGALDKFPHFTPLIGVENLTCSSISALLKTYFKRYYIVDASNFSPNFRSNAPLHSQELLEGPKYFDEILYSLMRYLYILRALVFQFIEFQREIVLFNDYKVSGKIQLPVDSFIISHSDPKDKLPEICSLFISQFGKEFESIAVQNRLISGLNFNDPRFNQIFFGFASKYSSFNGIDFSIITKKIDSIDISAIKNEFCDLFFNVKGFSLFVLLGALSLNSPKNFREFPPDTLQIIRSNLLYIRANKKLKTFMCHLFSSLVAGFVSQKAESNPYNLRAVLTPLGPFSKSLFTFIPMSTISMVSSSDPVAGFFLSLKKGDFLNGTCNSFDQDSKIQAFMTFLSILTSKSLSPKDFFKCLKGGFLYFLDKMSFDIDINQMNDQVFQSLSPNIYSIFFSRLVIPKIDSRDRFRKVISSIRDFVFSCVNQPPNIIQVEEILRMASIIFYDMFRDAISFETTSFEGFKKLSVIFNMVNGIMLNLIEEMMGPKFTRSDQETNASDTPNDPDVLIMVKKLEFTKTLLDMITLQMTQLSQFSMDSLLLIENLEQSLIKRQEPVAEESTTDVENSNTDKSPKSENEVAALPPEENPLTLNKDFNDQKTDSESISLPKKTPSPNKKFSKRTTNCTKKPRLNESQMASPTFENPPTVKVKEPIPRITKLENPIIEYFTQVGDGTLSLNSGLKDDKLELIVDRACKGLPFAVSLETYEKFLQIRPHLKKSRADIWKPQPFNYLHNSLICKNEEIKMIVENYLRNTKESINKLFSLLQNSTPKKSLNKLEISIKGNNKEALFVQNGCLVVGGPLFTLKFRKVDLIHCLGQILNLEPVSLPLSSPIPQIGIPNLAEKAIDYEFMKYDIEFTHIKRNDDLIQKFGLLKLILNNCEFIAIDFEFYGNKPNDNIVDKQYDFVTNVEAVLKYPICSAGFVPFNSVPISSNGNSATPSFTSIYQLNDPNSVWEIPVYTEGKTSIGSFLESSYRYLTHYGFKYSNWVKDSINVKKLADIWPIVCSKIIILFNGRMDLLQLLHELGEDISILKTEAQLLNRLATRGINFIDVKYVFGQAYFKIETLAINVLDLVPERNHTASYDAFLTGHLLRKKKFSPKHMNKLFDYGR